MRKQYLTKKRMERVVIFHASNRDFELLSAAAELREISRSDFLRQSLRKEASRILAGLDSEPHLMTTA